MGICIKIPDVTFKNYIGIAEIEETPVVPDVPDTYPVTDTLKGLYYLGGTQEDSLVNHAEGGSNAGITGSIIATDGYATFTGGHRDARVDTNITTSVENKTTIVALFRVPTGERYIVSNYAASTPGVCFTNGRTTVFLGSTSNKTYSTVLNGENFVLCAWSVDGDGFTVVQDLSGTQRELLTYSEPGCLTGFTKPWVIGGCAANLSYNETADIALVAIHEGDVTDEQLQQIFAHVRWYGESKGLTIA